MAHINLYLYNPHQVSRSYPFSSIDASVNTDSDANADSVWPGLKVSNVTMRMHKSQILKW